MRYRNRILVSAAALMLSLVSFAQEPKDSADAGRGWDDASAYSMLHRYRPKDKYPFRSYSFFDNTFAGFAFSRYNTFREEYADGLGASVILGKWINPFHGIRLEPYCNMAKENFDGTDVRTAGVNLSYIFNLTHFLGGYDPYRLLDMSTVIGGGGAYSACLEKKGFSWSAHIGLNMNFRVHRKLSLFVEPAFNILSNPGITPAPDDNHPYIPSLKAAAGVCYNFQNRDYDVSKAPAGMYVFASAGAMLHYCEPVANGDPFSTVGLTTALGVGFVCRDWLSFRTSLRLSNCLWDKSETAGLRANTYGALRLEALFDMVPLMSRKERHVFGFSLFCGPEFGYMRKTNGEQIITSFYAGLAAGLQFKVTIKDRYGILLEPSAAIVPYSAPAEMYSATSNQSRNYYDGLLGLSLGFQYSF